MKKIIYSIIILCACMLICGCSKSNSSTEEQKTNPEKSENKNELTVTSDSITTEGKWKSVITYTNEGENKCPQLSWNSIDGASCYAIYMIDESGNNWMHWIVKDYKGTDISLGQDIEDSKYIGPCPPGREHTYKIYVYALSASPDEYKGTFNNVNKNYEIVEQALDISGGKSGNIIQVGEIEGTYKTGEKVE